MKFKALIFTAFVALASCSPKTTTVETKEESIKFPNAKVEEGFNLQAQHCTACHKLKTVDDYSREQWDKILPNMAKKAKITPEQEATINEYINWELQN
jgi:mono/diheme cytochrome c family protein